MKLIVGLGNPGKAYENTRHNIGFSFLDSYILKKGFYGNWKEKYNGLYFETIVNGDKVLFLKPQSYMNLSGSVVSQFVNFYKISVEDLFVVSDDLDLNVGNFKLKAKGSCGGHNGLRDIEKNLKTQEYKRLKIGISNNKNLDTKDYVLEKFTNDEREVYKQLFPILCEVMDEYFISQFGDLMSKYNSKNR